MLGTANSPGWSPGAHGSKLGKVGGEDRRRALTDKETEVPLVGSTETAGPLIDWEEMGQPAGSGRGQVVSPMNLVAKVKRMGVPASVRL